MATRITFEKLSASTDGKAIKVVATATAGTTIHAADATKKDVITLYAYNSDTVERELTLEWGEATAPDGNIKVTVPSKEGLFLVVAGLMLTNSLVLKAFAAAANVIMLHGHVKRIG